MEFEKIKNILERYYFFGHTAKRDGYKMRYTFWSVPFFAITITVEVVKVNPNDINSPKLVTKIYINDFEINDIEALFSKLKCIYQLHKEILHGEKTTPNCNKRRK